MKFSYWCESNIDDKYCLTDVSIWFSIIWIYPLSFPFNSSVYTSHIVCHSCQAQKWWLKLEFVWRNVSLLKGRLQWKCIFRFFLTSLHGHMANNSRENKTSTPPPRHPTQRLLWRCDDLWCSTRVIGFNCHTIIPLCGSKVINFPLPVLSCHADPKFNPRKLHFHQYVVEFSKKQPAKSKRDELEWRDKEHCSFTIYIECIIHSLALMWTAAGYFDPHQAP